MTLSLQNLIRNTALALCLGVSSLAAQQASDPASAVATLAGRTRMRRDSFDNDPDWGRGDSYMKGLAKADGAACAMDLYTRGNGQDFRVRVDFHAALRMDVQHAPENVVFQGTNGGIEYWPIRWENGKPKATSETPTSMSTLLLAVSSPDAGTRLVEASEHALSQCGGSKKD